MRTEFAHFEKSIKALAITGNYNDEKWHCMAFYKQFKDGVHQQEIWFREMEDEPSGKEWMLDGGDEYELTCTAEENEWNYGFYYGCNNKTQFIHSSVCFAKGVGANRQLIIRSVPVLDREEYEEWRYIHDFADYINHCGGI